MYAFGPLGGFISTNSCKTNADTSKTADTEIVQNLKVLSATVRQLGQDEDPYAARAVFTLPVMPTWLNAMRNMHGGMVALLVDVSGKIF